jgi:hypothetical protein
MTKETETKDNLDVDPGLVAMFLKKSPEERLQANNNAARTILELRDAYGKQNVNRNGSKRTA